MFLFCWFKFAVAVQNTKVLAIICARSKKYVRLPPNHMGSGQIVVGLLGTGKRQQRKAGWVYTGELRPAQLKRFDTAGRRNPVSTPSWTGWRNSTTLPPPPPQPKTKIKEADCQTFNTGDQDFQGAASEEAGKGLDQPSVAIRLERGSWCNSGIPWGPARVNHRWVTGTEVVVVWVLTTVDNRRRFSRCPSYSRTAWSKLTDTYRVTFTSAVISFIVAMISVWRIVRNDWVHRNCLTNVCVKSQKFILSCFQTWSAASLGAASENAGTRSTTE